MMRCFHKNLAAKFLFFCLAILEVAYSAAPGAATVNFPVGTPGLVGVVAAGAVAAPGVAVIPGAVANAPFTRIQPVPGVPAVNLYFPVDGNQPTTQQAGIWSGAQVINAFNPVVNPAQEQAVTEWYMQMFGWVPPPPPVPWYRKLLSYCCNCCDCCRAPVAAAPPAPLAMGYNPAGGAASIISFDDTMDADRQAAFWDHFRTIAGDPAGRVLLYRLLIEIRRQNGGVGCEQAGVGANFNQGERNNARQLIISHVISHDHWEYKNVHRAMLYVCFEAAGANDSDTLATSDNPGNPALVNTLYTRDVHPYDMTCTLSHEMLHWYQQLRRNFRFDAESQRNVVNIANNDLSAYLGYPIAPAAAAALGDFLSWRTGPYIRVDEMRVICGSNAAAANYLEGDDLSENAFRCSQRLKMRFGHGGAILLANAIAAPATQPAIQTAHAWALQCVQSIVGHAVNWPLARGGALYKRACCSFCFC